MSGDVKFNLSTVFSTVARAIPDQNFLVWRDRRFSYAEFDSRIDGFARYLVAAGLGEILGRIGKQLCAEALDTSFCQPHLAARGADAGRALAAGLQFHADFVIAV